MSKKAIPRGFRLRHTLTGHRGIISRVAWSPDGKLLATPSRDASIRLWNPVNGQVTQTVRDPGLDSLWFASVAWSPDGQQLAAAASDSVVRIWDIESERLDFGLIGHTGPVHSVAWHPDGSKIATASVDRTMRLWDDETRELLWTRTEHLGQVFKVAWSPDGRFLASCADDATVRVWGAQVGLPLRAFEGHSAAVYDICWAHDCSFIASASADSTIRIWNPEDGRQIAILEGHSDAVISVSIYKDNQLLVSKSQDGTVILWRCDTWHQIATIDEFAFLDGFSNAVFHPEFEVMATQGEAGMSVRIWELDIPYLINQEQQADTVHYTNAKVVLVGDTGVGKTGLGLVLTGRPFTPTESSHGRHIWTMKEETVTLEDGREETRETLLWDLAGQPGYRLVHQLHLNEVAIALVLFDSRSEIDPFAGVRHWARALRQAERISSTTDMRKFLVAARVDRGGVGVSQAHIRDAMDKLGFDQFFETSAKEGWDIPELQQAIVTQIGWDTLPKVSSTVLFTRIKEFLIHEKEKGNELTTFDDLYRLFEQTHGSSIRLLNVMDDADAKKMLRQQFETCIGRVESRGLIRRLSFGNLILLQPELLDAYASAIVNYVKNVPDGLGSIFEEDLRNGRFRMSSDERIKDKSKEPLLLIATEENLLRHEIALREQSEHGALLVFPSEFTRERAKAPDPEGKAVVYTFEGPVLNIYATLVVRLLRSVIFKKDEMWHNLVTFKDTHGQTCGILLEEPEEGKGEMTLFFDEVHQPSRAEFEEYIRIHLQRRALPDSIFRRLIFRCDSCGFVVTEQLLRLRQEHGADWIHCPVCTTYVSLADNTEKIKEVAPEVVVEIDMAAQKERDLALAVSIFQGKIATRDYDVVLCYTQADRQIAMKIAEFLREKGILPWMAQFSDQPDVKDLPIVQIKAAIFILGKQNIGPGQPNQLIQFLKRLQKAGCPVIPALSIGAPKNPAQPVTVTSQPWIDLRRAKPEPISQLIHGITGGRGKTSHRQPSTWIIGSSNFERPPRVVDLEHLHSVMIQQLAKEELIDLYHKLRVRNGHDVSDKAKLAQDLISYCDRRGYIHNLIAHCRQLHENFPW